MTRARFIYTAVVGFALVTIVSVLLIAYGCHPNPPEPNPEPTHEPTVEPTLPDTGKGH